MICTRQDKCYNNTEEIECPAEGEDFYGQDAQYAALGKCTPQSFTVQTIFGDNIVVDNNTGLQWQQALKYCDDLSYAGYTDWRLPNKNEATTLFNYNKTADPYSGFPDMPGEFFWTSYTLVNAADEAWGMDFYLG